MRRLLSTMAGTLGALALGAGSAAAQGQPGCSEAALDTLASIGVPVVIVARVRADEVVFEKDPDVRVLVNGCEPAAGQVVTTSNLPDPIVPGVRYTDVIVTSEYRAVLRLECRASDDTVARLCDELRGRN